MPEPAGTADAALGAIRGRPGRQRVWLRWCEPIPSPRSISSSLRGGHRRAPGFIPFGWCAPATLPGCFGGSRAL